MSIAPPPVSSTTEPLYFVQVSDTHLGSRDSFRRTQQVIDHVNRLPLDIACVVHTGDIMDDNILDAPKVRRALELFAQFKTPIHFVPGNHDIIAGELNACETAFRSHFGELSTRQEYGGVVFLFVDSSAVTDTSQPGAARHMCAAVERELQAANGKPVLVFHHEPCVPFVQPRRPRFVGGWPEESRREWEALLNAYKVKAVVAGHCHQGIHHWLGEVPLYVAPSVIFGKPDCRLFEYRAGKLAYWTLHVDPAKPLRYRVRDKVRGYVTRLRRGGKRTVSDGRVKNSGFAQVRP